MTKKKAPIPKEKHEVQDLCPVDSQPLEQVGEYLVHSDHYRIVKASYDQAWEVYNAASKATLEEQKEAGEQLMDMLLKTNVAENKPLIKLFWKVPDESTKSD